MEQQRTTEKFLEVFEDFRMPPTLLDQWNHTGKERVIDKIKPFIAGDEPIRFVMLGYPFKSTNDRDKVLGTKPDMGEELSMYNFAEFNKRIKEIYSPGADITIVSDGYIFNKLLGASDATVQEYKEITMDMGKQAGAPMTWYDLQDFYSGKDLNGKREKILAQFAPSPEELQRKILMDPDTNFLYQGMIKFMNEEIANRFFVSNNQRQKEAKRLTREMMLYNEAYSSMVRKEFADHVRLSMHLTTNENKFGFKLIPGRKTMHSPWHSALVETGKEHVTLHRSDAEKLGLELVYKDGRPYYYMGEIKEEVSL